MAGSPAEQGRHAPSLFERLGDRTWWFDNGRRLGIQVGSLPKRLQDPYTKCSDIVRRYWGTGQASSQDLLPSFIKDYEITLLARRVNSGTADSNLIPTIEDIISRQIFWVRNAADFQGHVENPRTIFHLYHELISSAQTDESIPYLLQTLHSPFAIKGRESTKTDPPTFLRTEEERERKFSSRDGYKDDYWYYFYDVYEIVQHWDVHYPFAESAKVRVREINARTPDSRRSREIEEAIAHFDASRKREITTTAQTRHKRPSNNPLSRS